MLKELHLKNFRAFSSFRVNFRKENVLVGPNSAGKSTILTALRLARACLRSAYRVAPSRTVRHQDSWLQAYPIPAKEFEVLRESVHHEFRDLEASLVLRWDNGASLTAVWPPESDEEQEPFFYLRNKIGNNPRNPSAVKAVFHDIYSVPTLTPLEHEEGVLSDEYARKNLDTRLASRQFRNHIRLMEQSGGWHDFISFAEAWLGGYELLRPTVSFGVGSSPGVDLFYKEPGSSREKEVVWAGDGFQIWIQLLFQLYRGRGLRSVLLDEPEVFLHPDIQRRLVRLLCSLDQQFIFATHSAEVLTEVDASSIVWVEKSRRRAIRNPQDEQLFAMSSSIGSAFNLALAKALRARCVLFVEGQDAKWLRSLSRTLGYKNLEKDTSLAVVPINGFSHWERAQHFGWIAKEFLNEAIKGYVILDRDYRLPEQVEHIERSLINDGLAVHTWKKKEIESYLLVPEAIARLSKVSVATIDELIESAVAAEESHVFGQITAERMEIEIKLGRHRATIMQEARDQFALDWSNESYRRSVAPPKKVLSTVNAGLQSLGKKAVSFDAIAHTLREDEIDAEMAHVLEQIEVLSS
ncbi:ATP-dependent endonuclease [Micromonospora sp. NPDC048930]|uniref:ATP-dependent nuclease n=1 Tax=Micromonospora sp. NPDC048930 TaxID=3364261 RepID=UPI00371D4ADC